MEFRIIVILGTLMTVFVIDREMRVFFDKRRTSFPIYAASFLFYLVLMNGASILRIPWAGMVISLASRLVVSLNYEGSWKRRVVMLVSLMAIGVTIDRGVMQMFGIYFSAFFDGEALHTIWSVTISSLTQFMVALALQKLRNLKKDPVWSPLALVAIFAVPLLSTLLAMLISAYADMPPSIIFLTSSIIFGINVFVFYMRDRLSAAHVRSMEAALHEREKDYYLAQIRTMQESADQVKGIRHDMKNHLAAINAYAMENKGAQIAAYINALHSDIEETALHSNTGNIAFDSIITSS